MRGSSGESLTSKNKVQPLYNVMKISHVLWFCSCQLYEATEQVFVWQLSVAMRRSFQFSLCGGKIYVDFDKHYNNSWPCFNEKQLLRAGCFGFSVPKLKRKSLKRQGCVKRREVVESYSHVSNSFVSPVTVAQICV